jgi:hypothetical protein
MINKKRGYKSSRKAKSQDEGQLIDGMEIAKKLYNENSTPGEFVLQLLKEGKKYIPDFYRSDLQNEFDKIFDKQLSFHPNYLSNELKEELRGKKRDAVWAICAKAFKDKGFEIYGVSLDQDKARWLEAIQKDGITWPQVSDLKYWECEAAKLYAVEGIPYTVLLDKEGKIIAKNLRGADLEIAIEKALSAK